MKKSHVGQLGTTSANVGQLGPNLLQFCTNLELTWDQLGPTWGNLGDFAQVGLLDRSTSLAGQPAGQI